MDATDESIPAAHALSSQQQQLEENVYLQSTWLLTSLRHPLLRIAACLVHLLFIFALCSSSPLLGALQSPPYFPIYGKWITVMTTDITTVKLIFHVVLSVLLVAFLRWFVYRKWLQHKCNWAHQYRHAACTFSRLSSMSELRPNSATIRKIEVEPTGSVENSTTILLCTSVNSADRDQPRKLRVEVRNGATAQGSWTFVALMYPFHWALAVWVIQQLLSTVSSKDVNDRLFGNGELTMTQMQTETMLYNFLMAMSCIKLFVTIDLVLQDRVYSRALYQNWLVRVRHTYANYTMTRVILCWSLVLLVLLGGVYGGGFDSMQSQWLNLHLGGEETTGKWFSNESWRAMLSGLVVGLDLLWVAQDFTFPSLSTPVHVNFFGFVKDQLTVRLFGRLRLVFASKWFACFLVVGVLLPIELCQFAQVVMYAPQKYDQSVNTTSFRVFPANVNASETSVLIAKLSDTQLRLLDEGSISRFFDWSAWDRVPAVAVVLLSVVGITWLWRKERCNMRYSAFLGLPTQHEQAYQQKLNIQVDHLTKQILCKQTRLRELYALRTEIDNYCICLAALSVTTVMLQIRSIWRSQMQSHSLPLQSPGETYAALLVLITGALIYQLYQRYQVKMQLMTLRHEIPPECGNALYQSPRELLGPFVIELGLCALFLPPLVHGHIHMREVRYLLPISSSLPTLTKCPARMTMVNDDQACYLEYLYPLEIINMCVLVRLYWFVRVIRNYLMKDVLAEQLLMASGVFQRVPIDSLAWSFRISFKLAPGKLLVSLFALLWAGTAAAVSIFERPFPSLLDNEEHSLWLTIVTMTSVGYGDAYPMTACGRMAVFLGAVLGGAIFLSLMMSVFLNSLKGSVHERNMIGAMEKVRWQRKMWHMSVVLISTAWKHYQQRQISDSTSAKAIKQDAELFRIAQQFKVLRKQKPKETFDSVQRLQMNTIAHWRTHNISDWLENNRHETQKMLAELEEHLKKMEQSLQHRVGH